MSEVLDILETHTEILLKQVKILEKLTLLIEILQDKTLSLEQKTAYMPNPNLPSKAWTEIYEQTKKESGL